MFSEDVLVEILLRLPLIALARCLCVSKLWTSIIRSRHFINAYQSRSSTRQSCVMFTVPDIFKHWHFFSTSQPPSLVTNATRYQDSLRMPECVNGLICVEHMYRLRICNPVTGKGVFLPQSALLKPFTTWYMGYDPINYQYKVLFFSKAYLLYPYKTQVFTLGDQGSWKTINSGNNHTPVTRGICIDGVVYYGAHTMDGLRVVRFYVATEKFGNFIEVPDEASGFYFWHFGFCTLVNYQGKLALLARKTISIYDLWVLEDAAEKQEWSKVSFVITPEMCSYDLVWPGVLGFVAGSGEVVVSARDRFYQFHLVYVDLKMKRSREVFLGGMRSSYRSSMVNAFTDYVESIMFL